MLLAEHRGLLPKACRLHPLALGAFGGRLAPGKRLLASEDVRLLAEARLLHLLLELALERGLPRLELASGLLLLRLEGLLGLLLEELGIQSRQRPGLLTRQVAHPPGGNRGRGQPTTRHLLVQLLLLGLILGLEVRLTGLPHLLEGLLLKVRLSRSLRLWLGLHLRGRLGLHRLRRGRTRLPSLLHLGKGALGLGCGLGLHRLGGLDRSRGLSGLLLLLRTPTTRTPQHRVHPTPARGLPAKERTIFRH